MCVCAFGVMEEEERAQRGCANVCVCVCWHVGLLCTLMYYTNTNSKREISMYTCTRGHKPIQTYADTLESDTTHIMFMLFCTHTRIQRTISSSHTKSPTLHAESHEFAQMLRLYQCTHGMHPSAMHFSLDRECVRVARFNMPAHMNTYTLMHDKKVNRIATTTQSHNSIYYFVRAPRSPHMRPIRAAKCSTIIDDASNQSAMRIRYANRRVPYRRTDRHGDSHFIGGRSR